MYKLYVRRCRCEKWTYWTETPSLKILIKNIKIIEKYGWQWKVTQEIEKEL